MPGDGKSKGYMGYKSKIFWQAENLLNYTLCAGTIFGFLAAAAAGTFLNRLAAFFTWAASA
jgi:hypothetical protein